MVGGDSVRGDYVLDSPLITRTLLKLGLFLLVALGL